MDPVDPLAVAFAAARFAAAIILTAASAAILGFALLPLGWEAALPEAFGGETVSPVCLGGNALIFGITGSADDPGSWRRKSAIPQLVQKLTF